MLAGRMSGILLHPTSLPGPFGCGDLGPESYRFVRFLVNGGQRLWQVLPLGPTGYGNSPYMCHSAFAGNPWLISPEQLVEQGWLDPSDWQALPEWPRIQESFAGQVDFELVIPFKRALLQRAWRRFEAKASQAERQSFAQFCHEQAHWLDDYALFMTLLQLQPGPEWIDWQPELAHRDPVALDKARAEYAGDIAREQFWQYLFAQQWRALKDYANGHQVQIVGDLPIYVAYNSADVWANRHLFQLDAEGRSLAVAGVPPDYFSTSGQLWGNPLYDWPALRQRGYDWWVTRMRVLLQLTDCVRIDHFRAFERYWSVPTENETAKDGKWVAGPGSDFFEVLEEKLGSMPVIAEDLGDITPEVLALRDQFGFPGMKILEFAFGSEADNPYLPHEFERNCVVYTGTHDNDTVVGWFYGDRLSQQERQAVLRYLGCQSANGIHWDLIRLAFASVANLAIIPLQDVFGLGGDSRMNFPGKAEGNWGWRYSTNMLDENLSEKLAEMTLTYGRIKPSELRANQEGLRRELPHGEALNADPSQD